jgi:hypothetical protein
MFMQGRARRIEVHQDNVASAVLQHRKNSRLGVFEEQFEFNAESRAQDLVKLRI